MLVTLYNEDATCVELLRRVDAVPVDKEIIVVDDGSGHCMADKIRAALPGVRQLAHPQNRGKGAAIRTALSRASLAMLFRCLRWWPQASLSQLAPRPVSQMVSETGTQG